MAGVDTRHRALFIDAAHGRECRSRHRLGRVMSLVRRAMMFALLAALASAGSAAHAQNYPTRTVAIAVATPPGGQPDILARLIADRLSRALPQRFIVENRAGANGNLAPAHVAKVTPDGHTLLVASAPFLINPSLYSDLAFDVFRDFKPVAFLAAAPAVLTTNPGFPPKTLAEFIEHAKKN